MGSKHHRKDEALNQLIRIKISPKFSKIQLSFSRGVAEFWWVMCKLER